MLYRSALALSDAELARVRTAGELGDQARRLLVDNLTPRRLQALIWLGQRYLMIDDLTNAAKYEGLANEILREMDAEQGVPAPPAVPDWKTLMIQGDLAQAARAAQQGHDTFGEALSRWRNGEQHAGRSLARAHAQAALRAFVSGPRGNTTRELAIRHAQRLALEGALDLLVVVEDFALARVTWERAVAAPNGKFLFRDAGSEWEHELLRAEISAGLGEREAAVEAYAEAERALERTAKTAGTEFERASIYDRADILNRSAARFYLRNDAGRQAIALLERGRARQFHAQLFGELSITPGSPREAEARAFLHAQSRVAVLQRAVARAPDSEDARAALAREESLLLDAQNRLEETFGAGARTFTSDAGSDVVATASAALPDDSSAIAVYFFTQTETYGMVVTHSGLRGPVRLPLALRAAQRLMTTLSSKLKNFESDWEVPARALHDGLVRPLEPILPRLDAAAPPRLGFIVYGELSAIPFHLLVSEHEPLLARATIYYPPSLRSYPALVALGKTRVSAPVVAIGHDQGTLQYAEEEARTIASDAAHRFVGADATVSNFQKAVAMPALLHIATHALAHQSNPFEAEVMLADRNLGLDELAGMAVRSKLVTFNACDTDAGFVSRTGEHVSLARAFLANGVPSVVASEWRIADTPITSSLFRDFYENLRRGQDPAEALASAQRALARKGAPIWDWGAYQLVGSDR